MKPYVGMCVHLVCLTHDLQLVIRSQYFFLGCLFVGKSEKKKSKIFRIKVMVVLMVKLKQNMYQDVDDDNIARKLGV